MSLAHRNAASANVTENKSFIFWIALVGFLLLMLNRQCEAGTAEVSALLNLQEKEIDIGRAALILAKELDPDFDIAAYSRHIDLLAQKVSRLSQGTQDPDQRIRALNTVLYQIEGFRYDHSASAIDKLESHSLKGILDTKLGTCVTMPLLYLAVAQRLGYPVYAVSTPNHIFLRYVDSKLDAQNIEATSGGGYSPDAYYIREMQVSKRALRSGGYMRTMTHRQFLAMLIEDTVIALYRNHGNIDRSIQYLKITARILPTFPDHYATFARSYMVKSRLVNEESAKQYRKMAEAYWVKAEALGYVKPVDSTTSTN
jgi:regulator of sirC expression with transglutaminase-like and TPR domain